MPRSSSPSIDALVREAMADVVRRASQDIARAIAQLAADELGKKLSASVAGGARAGRGAARRAAPRAVRAELTRWTADRRARRVPKFVIEQTGLGTKKEIVARFGEDATFEKGKPAPKPRA